MFGSRLYLRKPIEYLTAVRLVSRLSGFPLKSQGISNNATFFKSNSMINLSRNFHANRPVGLLRKYNIWEYSRRIIYRGPVGKYSTTWHRYNRHYKRNDWNRLKLPLLFTVLFCATTTLTIPYVMNVKPFSYLKRNPQAIVYGIIAINCAVFGMWRLPQFSRFLMRYGLLSKDGMYSAWSMLGSAFSHQSFLHLFVNMFVLHSFGTSICAMIGAANFLTLFLNSAVISSFVSIVYSILTRSFIGASSLGASGSVFGIFGCFSYLFPKAPLAFFFIPVPGGSWIFFLGTLAYNFAGCALRWGRYDFAAHLGGSMVGIGYGWWLTKKRQERIRRTYRF